MTAAELDVANDKAWETQKKMAVALAVVASYSWVTWALMILGMNYAAEKAAYKIRMEYFRKSLEKDAAYYDLHNPTEIASKISKDVSLIKAGLGQKYGHVIQGYASFACGVTIGLIYGWLLALILVAAFPIMAGLIMLQTLI